MPNSSENEYAHVKASRPYPILDNSPVDAFDRITSLAAQLLSVPLCMIMFDDEDRIWVKSSYGTDLREIERNSGLCGAAIYCSQPYIVEDVCLDNDASKEPLIDGQNGIRFYAGVPLTGRDGQHLGVLCVLDYKPRHISVEDIGILETLAQVVMDELELKRIADELRTEELRQHFSKLHVSQQLAAGLAHEIRNPLTAVKGFLQLMGSRSEFRSYIEIMTEELNQIEALTKEFILLSRPYPSVKFVKREPLSIIRQVQSVLSTEALQNGVSIEVEVEGPGNFYLYCDEQLLKRAIINVVKNGIDAMPDGGVVKVTCVDTGNRVIIRVADTGRGIEPERIPYLGQPYYGTKEQGIGLGLMTSYKIIHEHHGEIEITSELNRGTVVEISLPAIYDA
ncbi:GAF domain-containing sensor histidine kinase [Paenibacillus sp. CF384]|uniref:GAF domain-containing sensor histidine kinase n=1 Tax=Paenibacillus sp. CF384 TaxID=1884382 RepID=UPI000896BB7E|nr:GAF domain-containing sensor histidine kinase [Paenibacillus sp. CF384]SDW68690.1 Signal transduction histidine kinase [Paenibacillus sp. CF384]